MENKVNDKLSLETIAQFTWGFSVGFLLEVNGKYYEWKDPEYGGDNTISPYYKSPKHYALRNFAGRDKGTHAIGDYCGNQVTFVNC